MSRNRRRSRWPRDFLLPLLEPLATTGIVFVVLIFILLQREDLRDRMIRLFGSSDLHRTTAAMDDAARRLSRYFLTQLGLNAAFGVVVALGLWAIGVPSPLLWGIFAGADALRALYRLVHRGLLPIALAAAVDPGWSMALHDAGALPRSPSRSWGMSSSPSSTARAPASRPSRSSSRRSSGPGSGGPSASSSPRR